MELKDLKGIGKSRQEQLNAAGIFSLRDLLSYLPIRYKDTLTIKPLSPSLVGETVTIEGAMVSKGSLYRYGGGSRVSYSFLSQNGEKVNCVWFNQPWMAKYKFPKPCLLNGTLSIYKDKFQLTNPHIESKRGIIPVYKPIASLGNKTLTKLIEQAISGGIDEVEPLLEGEVVKQFYLMDKKEAIKHIHKPKSKELLTKALRLLRLEKLLIYQGIIRELKGKKSRAKVIQSRDEDAKKLWNVAGFIPTDAQTRALDDIRKDLSKPLSMNRLVQGDVGSGKTIVAFGALLFVALNGYQGALMAPTEILATQHYLQAKEFFKSFGLSCGLMLGGMTEKEKRQARESICKGEWDIVIGTQALISKATKYKNLALVITDEQHRFGVAQRTDLIYKGLREDEMDMPHLLVMSATPIPRTLALMMYGDLDISIIDELPPGRKPVSTHLVPEIKREGMYRYIKEHLDLGRQAYMVCPLVEDSEELEGVKSVQSHYHWLKTEIFKNYNIAMTHGAQKGEEKQKILREFQNGQIDILVTTTVIEVGVNVPNATIMVIEDANRYGLSQLHQLRGRVGRGSEESWCFLLSEPNERLKALVSTNDGFKIAEKDLELRGPGDIIGLRQHGHLAAEILSGDRELIEESISLLNELENNIHYRNTYEKLLEHSRIAYEETIKKVSLN